MHIIKPYGRSHVGTEEGKRVLHLNADRKTERDIVDFAASHDELIIAQWISAIDKIATKPANKNGPTQEQRELRRTLGAAAWRYLESKSLLPGLRDKTICSRLHTLWGMKIEPYGDLSYKPKKIGGRECPPPSAKGRWYRRFAEECDPAKIDAELIAKGIYEHLHCVEYRIDPTRPNKRQGRIEARAESIRTSVLCDRSAQDGWTKPDEDAYAQAGDVAAEIIRQANACRRRVNRTIAGAALFDHYARIFKDEAGAPLSIEAARKNHAGLFALHGAVKDCYTRLLKDHRKQNEAIIRLLPADMGALFALVKAMGNNRDVNALIRLGKVIHYQAYEAGRDFANWPCDVTASRFWGSDGQAEIKRNEAFVRVWRHVLALAQRTLMDWAGPNYQGEDVLINIQQVLGKKNFRSDTFRKKLALLFGDKAGLFPTVEADEKAVLGFALEKTAALRNSSFHFVGRTGFIQKLETLGAQEKTYPLPSAVKDLWDKDCQGQANRIQQTLRGAQCDFFFDRDRNRKILSALVEGDSGKVPLPRFRRALIRAEDAWKGKGALRLLPPSANRSALEDSARRCQYTVLKLLYERPFRAWLEKPERKINDYVDRAVQRASQAARTINAKKMSEQARALVISRMKSLPRPADDESIWNFFFDLSAATATEMRVQRGYESDATQAKEQAEFIEDLRCDVVALAFADFLKDEGFSFVLALKPETSLPDQPQCDLDDLAPSTGAEAPKEWQTVLYFLLHLVPVDEVGKLLHQLRKWEILAAPPKSGQPDEKQKTADLQTVLSLYLDMHDSKFEGGAALTGTEGFKILFECPTDFDRVFPQQNPDDQTPDDQARDDQDRRIPRRGLREIMRFGHLPVLKPFFEKHPTTTRNVEEWLGAEIQPLGQNQSFIAKAQERREELHEEWTKDKDKWKNAQDKVKEYASKLSEVTEHRHRAAHVTLTNHVRLHRLMMAILGRLVDFSGLWERDLYFVSLALIARLQLTPADVFGADGLKDLATGQIVAALDKVNPQDQFVTALNDWFKDRGGQRKLRNNFMHFEMLRKSDVNLTACVNEARTLMSYDRKLKNAVAQSIIELLDREGLELTWKMDGRHQLGSAQLESRIATHLGGLKGEDHKPVTEALHGEAFVQMAATLFGGTVKPEMSLEKNGPRPVKRGSRG